MTVSLRFLGHRSGHRPGPIARAQAIDEYDFHGGDDLSIEGQPQKRMTIEILIAGLDDQLTTKFRNNLEFWRTADRT